MNPPNDVELEKQAIKMMIDDADSIPILVAKLKPDDFYNMLHANNFKQIKKDYIATGEINISALQKAYQYLESDYFNTAAFAEEFADKIINLKKLRVLHFHQGEPVGDDAKAYIEKTLQIFSGLGDETKEKNEIKDVLAEAYEDWCNIGDGIAGDTTGLDSLDDVIDGYCPGHYWVIGAYTNYGKTSLACWLLAQYIRSHPDNHVAFFSVEMSKKQISERIITQYTGQPIWKIRHEPTAFDDEIDQVAKSNVHIFDRDRTPDAIRLKLMALKARGRLPRLVFVDFIQNLHVQGGEYEGTTKATLELQTLAGDLGITIIALSQISNEGAKAPTTVIPFKGSGAIAASADLGIILHRDRQAELESPNMLATLTIQIRKNRHGKLAEIPVLLNQDTGVINK